MPIKKVARGRPSKKNAVSSEAQALINILQSQIEIKNEKPRRITIEDELEAIKNGYQFAYGLPSNNFYGPGVGGNPWAPQISQTNVLFENLRWYLISNFRQPLSEAYIEIGLIQKLVDVPVDDGLRGGVEINSKQLGEDNIKELLISVERDNDLVTCGQGLKWTRLFGGGGIIVMVEDQDPETPLDISKINKNSKLEFRACDLWELFPDSQNVEGYNPTAQAPEFENYDYYGEKLHKSRVMILKGRQAPSFIRPRLRGWGLSEVETLIRSLNQYLKSSDVIFSCLDEFKVDVFKLKGLVNTLMSPQGNQKVRQRVAIAGQQKNYENAIVLDSEDEWDHKQISFAGIAETLEGIRMQVASEMNMPITKLFGTTASSGLGNTDQNDMENYNSMVEAQVRNKIKYHLIQMLEIKCQFLFGFIPDDLEISFKPLRVLTAVEEETVKTSQFARMMQAVQLGQMSSEQFADACNKSNLLPVKIDGDQELLIAEDDETEEGPKVETKGQGVQEYPKQKKPKVEE